MAKKLPKIVKNTDISKKKAAITREKARLKKIYKDLEPVKQILAEKLIESAAFLSVTLKNLQDQMLDLNNLAEKQQNGPRQFFTKQSTYVTVYETTLKSYGDIIAQLDKMLPKPKPVVKKAAGETDDELEKFINSR
jgi:regulator of replication initiation timing